MSGDGVPAAAREAGDPPRSAAEAEDLRLFRAWTAPGETILWTGRAAEGAPLRSPVVLGACVAGGAVCAFGLASMAGLVGDAPGVGALLALGGATTAWAAWTAGRAALAAARYAVTDRQALAWNGRALRGWPLRPGLIRRVRPDAVVFAPHPDAARFEGGDRILDLHALPGFVGLADPSAVLSILAQAGVRPPGPPAAPAAPDHAELAGDRT
ncbi:hypothetical protein ACQ5SO_13960 [Rhodovulum sp. DZ06]|uniref:hypothetical protein n=1 Tax=Rhodovulum sp. DZ06 TaxID=3425126 RepID=UPI003D33600F